MRVCALLIERTRKTVCAANEGAKERKKIMISLNGKCKRKARRKKVTRNERTSARAASTAQTNSLACFYVSAKQSALNEYVSFYSFVPRNVNNYSLVRAFNCNCARCCGGAANHSDYSLAGDCVRPNWSSENERKLLRCRPRRFCFQFPTARTLVRTESLAINMNSEIPFANRVPRVALAPFAALIHFEPSTVISFY